MVKGRSPITLIRARHTVNKNFRAILGEVNVLETFVADEPQKYTAFVQPNNIGLSYSKLIPVATAYKLEQYRNKFHTIIINMEDSTPFDLIIDAYVNITKEFNEREKDR